MPPHGFATIAARARVEIERVQRSRFIGSAAPCEDAASALAFLDSVRADFHDARHHAFAWRLGPDAALTRASDDGEPHNSAGAPVLRELEARGLTNAVVVVSRYFGGVKLGTGGLARAYGAAAAAVLEQAGVRFVPLTVPVHVAYPYELTGAVSRVLHHLRLEPAAASWAARVELTLRVGPEDVDRLVAALRDATAGSATIEVGTLTPEAP